MSGRPKFYITTAISYPNGQPHIGHAYEAIATDAIARFERLDGKDVYFLTGTDEHGLKMKQTAAKEGLTPRELADRNAKRFREMAGLLGLSNDDFIRTTEPRHYRASEEIWRRMEAAGDIFLKKYAGWYSVRDEAFYNESETTLGDDGVRRGPQGTPVEWTEEETYFFRLSAYQDKLLAHYDANPDFILPPERRNEVTSFVQRRPGGSVDLAHDARLGHPGAGAEAQRRQELAAARHVRVGRRADELHHRRRLPRREERAVALLAGRRARHRQGHPALPRRLLAGVPDVGGSGVAQARLQPRLRADKGEKMSKSVGNVVDPFDLVHAYGLEQVRYFFLREVNFGQDGNYQPEAIANRINADLANDLGNLAQRSLSMINKNCGARVPEPGEFTEADKAILAAADGALRQGARGDGSAGDHPLPRRGVGGRRRRQPLLRRRGAVGEEEDRPQAHGDDPLCDGRGGAAGRHPGRAGDAARRGKAARPLGPGRRRPHIQGAGRGRAAEARHGAARAAGRLPALHSAGGGAAGREAGKAGKQKKAPKDKAPKGQGRKGQA